MRHFRMLAVLGGSLLLASAGLMRAQPAPPPLPPPDQALTPQQLEDLVAPIALYPDPLLTQILVASTYPLEVVEAFQWLQHNPGLTGAALTSAAQQQNWDASVQALVVFPDVVKRLNDDVTWTTNLGNAFLAQQAEVMDAVQRLRQKAQQAGKLNSTPQETVSSVPQSDGPPAIEIQPADPDVIYVPAYNPAWFWGPALYYPYPGWYWPPEFGVGIWFGWGPAIHMGFFFGGGWGGWGGWGWHPGWGGRTIIVNNTFIHRYNFNSAHLAQLHGNSVWQHDPAHRAGVPYARPELANRYQSSVRTNLRPTATQMARQSPSQANERMGNRNIPKSNSRGGLFGGISNGRAARINSDHGFSSLGAARTGGGGFHPSGGGGRRR
ncbi:MAG TPA: DUF3300 domain-containing protein [Bryobacteraceae bacterium]|nr:DUF3300 domain-containing protein [Bryobacteraceae bacterium]